MSMDNMSIEWVASYIDDTAPLVGNFFSLSSVVFFSSMSQYVYWVFSSFSSVGFLQE
jgi:hypothetical protein